jgi:hypothetical protein
MTKELKKQLATIKPGENYPAYVHIKEKTDKGKDIRVKFLLQSYVVGMYCAIHINESVVPDSQAGDHDNKKFVRNLKKDIKNAIDRGAEVVIGDIREVKRLETV